MIRKNIFISVNRSFGQPAKNQNQQPKPEGTVTIEKQRNNEVPGRSGNTGDYVDYEEVK